MAAAEPGVYLLACEEQCSVAESILAEISGLPGPRELGYDEEKEDNVSLLFA